MGGANQHHDPPSGGADGEGHVSHSAILTHFSAMSRQVLIQTTADSAEGERNTTMLVKVLPTVEQVSRRPEMTRNCSSTSHIEDQDPGTK